MSKISSVSVTDRTVEVEYPGIEGFKITLAYISRDAITKIRDSSVKLKFNPRTRQREEEVDQEKFLKLYVEKVIRGWSGLKMGDLHKLLPVEVNSEQVEEEIPYSQEEAYDLISESTLFDQFVTDCMNDLDTFDNTAKEESVKN